MNKLEEQIEEILQEHITFGYADEQFLYDQKGLLEELSTLIQQERADATKECMGLKMRIDAVERENEIRREAVEGFVGFLYGQEWDYDKSINEQIRECVKEYLNSIGSEKSDGVVTWVEGSVSPEPYAEDFTKYQTSLSDDTPEETGRTWYFDGDELVIKRGKWVLDRYPRQYPNSAPSSISSIKKEFENRFGKIGRSATDDKCIVIKRSYDGGTSEEYIGDEVWGFILFVLSTLKDSKRGKK